MNTNLSSRIIGQIIAFNMGVPVVNAPVLGNLREYRRRSWKLDSLSCIFIADSAGGLSATGLTREAFSVLMQNNIR